MSRTLPPKPCRPVYYKGLPEINIVCILHGSDCSWPTASVCHSSSGLVNTGKRTCKLVFGHGFMQASIRTAFPLHSQALGLSASLVAGESSTLSLACGSHVLLSPDVTCGVFGRAMDNPCSAHSRRASFESSSLVQRVRL